jgi:type IV pilus assembly protein PilQ
VDEKNNLLILSDLPEALTAAETLIARLDQAPMQVEIEARIVRTTREFARELGLRWGFGGAAAPELGNTTGLAFPNTIRADGLAGSINQGADFARLSLGALNGALTLDAALSALETDRKVNILLRPRVVTQNNIKAQITRGQEIPYTTLAAPPAGDGVQILQPIPQVQFKTAALTLMVTPRITASDTIILEVDVDNGSPGPAEANGNRAINTQRVQTVVLVRNEATTVIGGIYEAADTVAEERTPGLGRVPLLGRLFRRNVSDDAENELLVFITPRILRDGGPVK